LQSFETELLAEPGNLAGLRAINRELIPKADAFDSPQRVVLDQKAATSGGGSEYSTMLSVDKESQSGNSG
jgi:hypothetical protein